MHQHYNPHPASSAEEPQQPQLRQKVTQPPQPPVRSNSTISSKTPAGSVAATSSSASPTYASAAELSQILHQIAEHRDDGADDGADDDADDDECDMSSAAVTPCGSDASTMQRFSFDAVTLRSTTTSTASNNGSSNSNSTSMLSLSSSGAEGEHQQSMLLQQRRWAQQQQSQSHQQQQSRHLLTMVKTMLPALLLRSLSLSPALQKFPPNGHATNKYTNTSIRFHHNSCNNIIAHFPWVRASALVCFCYGIRILGQWPLVLLSA